MSVSLPGVDDPSTSATLTDQLKATLETVDRADRPMVVGHSAACTLAWMAADNRPEAIERLVLIGGFPPSSGEAYADIFPIADRGMPFPGWEPFEGADSADLDESARKWISSVAVPVPERVARGIVRLNDDRRFDIPTVLICPEYSPEDAKAWVDDGDVPELSQARHVSYVDIDSGHWPMVTRPGELARILHAAASNDA